jgi:histidyl-tRNA synthetase
MTAPVCRLLASGALSDQPTPHKLYYVGSCFRYCRPQPGKYREFTQAGIECLGSSGPAADAEVIAAACRFLRQLGISRFALKLGSVGIFRDLLKDELDAEERAVVVGHLDRLTAIDERCRLLAETGQPSLFEDLKIDRLELAAMQASTDYSGPYAISDKPNLTAAECAARLPLEAEASFRHLWSVEDLVSDATSDLLIRVSRLKGPVDAVHQQAQGLLQGTGATEALENLLAVSRHVQMYGVGDFEVALGIARGFTFYTSTVFEITSAAGDGAQTYCGGGRYDRLVEEFGGPSLPSTGCAFFFERLVDAFLAQAEWSAPRPYQVFLLADSERTLPRAIQWAEQWRQKGLRVGTAVGPQQRPSLEDCRARQADWIGLLDQESIQKNSAVLSDGTQAQEIALEDLPGVVGRLIR